MYISVKLKFSIALFVATLWFLACAWISLPWIVELATHVGLFFSISIVLFIALIPGFMQMFLFTAYLMDKRPTYKEITEFPPISVLIAAYNEEADIHTTLTSILAQDYAGEIQIILSDDGSTDRTIVITQSFKNHPILILKNEHGGKAHCLNQALAHAKHDLVIGIDADTHLRPNAITNIVKRYLSDPPNTAAVAGSVFVKNSRVNFMTRLQEWDYFQAITAIKRMQSLFQGTLVAQGAFSLYRKDCLKEVNGWPDSIGEDIVVTWKLLQKGYRIGFCETAVSFTSAPTTYSKFFRQRSRWASGLIEAFHLSPKILITRRLTLLLIYWNFLFPIMDFMYVFVFLPGLILAFFGHFYIAGPMTLALLPLAILYNAFFYFTERKVFKELDLKIRKNKLGFIAYLLIYQILMAPACIHGYLVEFLRLQKKWK